MKLKTVSVDTCALRTLLQCEETAPLSESVIERYRQELEATRMCDPLRACYDGHHYTLFDGYHRLEAMRKLGFNSCLVTVYKGDHRDAYRRYIKDKLRAKELSHRVVVFRHCLARLKADPQWSAMEVSNLCRLFGRKPEFFHNLRLWEVPTGHPSLMLWRTKHGTMSLAKRYRT